MMKRYFTLTLFAALGMASAIAQEVSSSAYDSLLKRIEVLEQSLLTQKNEPQEKDVKVRYNGDPSFQKFRFGGYGEMLLRHKDYSYNRWAGNGVYRMDRSEVSIPRFVIAGDYKFSRWFQLSAEIEFESGGVGTTWEQESGSGAENGELETEWEKGGEVALEQFHLTVPFLREVNLRLGHLIVPVGITNAHHEPIFFFGTSRPEGESMIIPSTWHETGVELFGTIGHNYATFDYDIMLVNGLTADGLDKYKFLGGAKQGLFEQDLFSCPAFAARLDYKGVPGLRIGGSFYYCKDAGKNSNYPHYYSDFETPIRIFSVDAQYVNKWVTVRGNILHGSIGNTTQLTRATLGRTSKAYSGNTPIGKTGVSYAGEVGVNIGNCFKNSKKPLRIYPFARYEYYNPQQELDNGWVGEVADPRCQVSMWTFGIDWYPLPFLVIKGDWSTHHIGTNNPFDWNTDYKSENDLSLGIAYVGWFCKK